MGVPALMSAEKQNLLLQFQRKIPDAVEMLQTVVDKSVKQTQSEILEALRPSVINIETPPLVEYCIRCASRNSSSLLESVAAIRQTDQAQAFRKYAYDLQQIIMRGDRAGDLILASELNQLARLAREWGARGTSDYGVLWKDAASGSNKPLDPIGKTISAMAGIPVIGFIASILAALPLPGRDLIVQRKRYLMFMSQWYKE